MYSDAVSFAQITLKSERNALGGYDVGFYSNSGARVAYLRSGEQEIVFDVFADTQEAMGMICFRDVLAELAITPAVARTIIEMPSRDIEPWSAPE